MDTSSKERETEKWKERQRTEVRKRRNTRRTEGGRGGGSTVQLPIPHLPLTHMAPTLSHIRTLCFTQELRPTSDLLTLPLTPTALSYPLNTLNE